MTSSPDDALRQLTWELSLAYEALTAVYTMTQRLAGANGDADIWLSLHDALARVLQVRCGRILVPSDDAWVEVYTLGDPQPLADPRATVLALMDMAQGRSSLRLNDAAAIAALPGLAAGSQTLLAVPVEGQRTEAWVVLEGRRDETGGKPFTTGDQKLVSTLAQQAGFAVVSRRAAQEEVRLARLNRELEIARDIQTSLLQPDVLSLAGWEIALESHPAFEVSGDYCGFEPTLGAPGAGLLLTDVMGKGVPAALFAATARAVLLALGAPQDPLLLVTRLERVLQPDLLRLDSFMALTYVSLAPQSGLVRLLNAGNPPVYLKRAKGDVETYLSSGRPIGWPGRSGTVAGLELNPGDVLVMITDGVFDQVNEAGEPFGEERLAAVLGECDDVAPVMLAAITAAVRAHQGHQPALDDMTLAVLRRLP